MFYPLQENSPLQQLVASADKLSREVLSNLDRLKSYQAWHLASIDMSKNAVFTNHKKENNWASTPIFNKDSCSILDTTKNTFPYLFNILTQIDKKHDIEVSSICMLDGEQTFPAHRHESPYNIFHLNISKLESDCIYISDDETKTVRDVGDYVMFDLKSLHGVKNTSKNKKISIGVLVRKLF